MWMLPPNANRLPRSGESATELWLRARPLAGTAAEAYLERRRVALAVAAAAEVRYTDDLNGRPAVLGRLVGPQGELRAVHGRHLEVRRGEGKMFTVGEAGGVFVTLDGLAAAPLVLVEGMFDALSVGGGGLACVATIGRWVDWLPAAARGREVWLAFDANRPGERSAREFAAALAAAGADCRRLRPPSGHGDWNAEARRHGAASLARWLERHAAGSLEEVR